MSQAASNSSPYRNSGLFSGYYLEDRINDLDEWECDDEAEAAFAKLNDLWESEGDLLPSYKEDELLGSWIDKILDALGYATLQETTLPGGEGYNDRLLFESTETRREGSRRKQEGNVEAMYGLSSAILEAKQYDSDFNTKFDEQRSYHDASHQIRYYLDRAGGEVDWGILTNGKEWRLYGTKDYATEIYYEVDLVDLLKTGNVEEFKYFYAFFRPDAFRETAGTTFLNTVWNESETAAQELGEDLQDNVFTALRILGEGFVKTNDLEIGSEDGADIEASELKEQSLVLLYRLMFVLYAESRGLVQPDEPEKEAEYDENFSLDQLRLEIDERISSGDSYEDYSQYSTTIWGQLQDLFALVDSGSDNLGIPPYNGGLFDAEEHEFLANNEVADPYITEIIHRLGTTENDDGELVLADYADLDTRHLGTIYEGLLEHEFRIAPEQYAAVSEDGGQVWKPATEVNVADAVESVDEGSLYVVNDDGERKATGAYYTPDYVVSYIVEETIDPLLNDIKNELEADGLEPSDQAYFGRFYSQLLDLQILDPAMGSAHFLTNATGYLTEQVMEIVREQELQGRNEQELRRTIAKECIYGVDINGMAVELGKLSMWLETLAADKPLAFLDHHIKTGNSLVGSNITEVLSDDTEENGGQLTLGEAIARVKRQTLEHVMGLMEELLAIDNDNYEDIQSMEEIYDDIRADALYQRLFEIANVHTAEEFGLDVPEGVYEQMASAIEEEAEWGEIQDEDWFTSAQSMADDESFFHWELEFPEVFFGSNGSKLESAGFDVLIGNPPYVRIYGDTLPEPYVEYLRETYSTAHMKFDLYVVFSELGIDLTRSNGTLSYIIPDKFTSTPYGEPLRDKILKETKLLSVLDLRDRQVFDDATVSNLIPVLQESNATSDTLEIRSLNDDNETTTSELPTNAVVSDDDHSFRLERTVEDMQLTSKIRDVSIRFDKIFYTNWGLRTGTAEKTDKYVVEDSDRSDANPMVRGQDIIEPYRLREPSEDIIYKKDDLYNPMFEELFENEKIIFRKISGAGLMAVADENEYYCFSTLIPCVNIQRVADVDRAGIPDVTPESQDYEDIYYALAIVNSSLLEWFYGINLSDELSVVPGHINELPIAKIENTDTESDHEQANTLLDSAQSVVADESPSRTVISEAVDALSAGREWLIHDTLSELARMNSDFHSTHEDLNLWLPDYLGAYDEGEKVINLGLTQPPTDSADSILQQTSEQKPNLRVGEGSVVRESSSTVEIQLTARYKPDDEDAYETDQWGYTETDPLPALRITDLTETEADLIEAFVPVAVDEAGGFANFRETATKTNSLVDRLHKLTLPAVSDVETGLKSYMQTKERAEELEAKIEQTDELIDKIVYELYGLTDEEIEIVEEAVST